MSLWKQSGGSAIVALVLIALAGGVAASSFSVVPESQQALVLRNGEVRSIVNAVDATSSPSVARQGAGIVWHWPLIDTIERFDRRPSLTGIADISLTTADRGEVDASAFVQMRVIDVTRLRGKAGTEVSARRNVAVAYANALRAKLSGQPLATVLATRGFDRLDPANAPLLQVAHANGLAIVNAGVSAVTFGEAARQGVIEDMRARLRDEAISITMQGEREALAIDTQANADVGRIYAASMERDPQFYAFYRAMQSYIAVFAGPGEGKTPMVLPPDAGYLEKMRGQ